MLSRRPVAGIKTAHGVTVRTLTVEREVVRRTALTVYGRSAASRFPFAG
jgi:hypothetical protein